MHIEKQLPETLRPLWIKRRLIATIVSSITLVAIVVSLLLPKWYQATSVILSPKETTSSLGALGALGSFGVGMLGQDTETLRYLAILKSRVLAERMIVRFNLQEKYKQKTLDETIEVFRGNLNFFIDEESQVVVRMLDKDQDLVATKLLHARVFK